MQLNLIPRLLASASKLKGLPVSPKMSAALLDVPSPSADLVDRSWSLHNSHTQLEPEGVDHHRAMELLAPPKHWKKDGPQAQCAAAHTRQAPCEHPMTSMNTVQLPTHVKPAGPQALGVSYKN